MGEELHHQAKEALQMTKEDDGLGEEENEEDDTDEETVSVTSSSQVSAGRVRSLKWNVVVKRT